LARLNLVTISALHAGNPQAGCRISRRWFEPSLTVCGWPHYAVQCYDGQMQNITITSFNQADLNDLLGIDERLLWSGQPGYGRKFFQTVGSERMAHIGFVVGAVIMWSTLPFIEIQPERGRATAIWVYSAVSMLFVVSSFTLASQRQYVLYNLAYFVTDKRAIVCRLGKNWRLASRLYVVSCPHSETYPYSVIASHPYPSLQVGTLLSEDLVQPFGLGLSHPGHPIMWGRITAPIMLDYVPNAQDLQEMIRSCARETCAHSDA
jgi:hypothetical protein